MKRFSVTAQRFAPQVGFVAEKLGNKGVVELEQLATALYVRLKEDAETTVEERAARINELKPHISEAEARRAVGEVDRICAEAVAVAGG
jgi:hypothetical protein